ncbi:hypothetical protein D3C78_1690600 [compost metagenome]
MGLADHHQADQDNRRQGQQAQDIAPDGIQGAATGQVLKTVGQARSLVKQGLRLVEDIPGRLAYAE